MFFMRASLNLDFTIYGEKTSACERPWQFIHPAVQIQLDESALWAVTVSVIASVSAACGLTAINVTVNNMLPKGNLPYVLSVP